MGSAISKEETCLGPLVSILLKAVIHVHLGNKPTLILYLLHNISA